MEKLLTSLKVNYMDRFGFFDSENLGEHEEVIQSCEELRRSVTTDTLATAVNELSIPCRFRSQTPRPQLEDLDFCPTPSLSSQWKTQRLQQVLNFVKSTECDLGKAGWLKESSGDSVLYFKKNVSGKATFKLTGRVSAPIGNLLSVVYEADLHGNWVPFMKKASLLHTYSNEGPATILGRHRLSSFPLSDREMTWVGFGADCLEEENEWGVQGLGAVVVYLESVNCGQSHWGVPVPPPSSGSVELRTDCLCFVVKPGEEGLELTLLATIDPNMPNLNEGLLKFFAKQSARQMFANLKKLSAPSSFDRSAYRKRREGGGPFYDWLHFSVLPKLRGSSLPSPSSSPLLLSSVSTSACSLSSEKRGEEEEEGGGIDEEWVF